MNTEEIKNTLARYDHFDDNLNLDDRYIDAILEINHKASEKNINHHDLTDQFGTEQYLYEGTPYDYIRHFLNVLSPAQNDVIYDLGSGYGRVIIYGSLTKDAQFRGIEIVPERVRKVLEIKNRLSINNLQCYQSNVLESDYSDGNIFFLFNPFFYETLILVGDKLKTIAKNKKIKIVTWGGSSNDYFAEQIWLRDTRTEEIPLYSRLQFFESKID